MHTFKSWNANQIKKSKDIRGKEKMTAKNNSGK